VRADKAQLLDVFLIRAPLPAKPLLALEPLHRVRVAVHQAAHALRFSAVERQRCAVREPLGDKRAKLAARGRWRDHEHGALAECVRERLELIDALMNARVLVTPALSQQLVRVEPGQHGARPESAACCSQTRRVPCLARSVGA
jgi:hypothetical protein